LQANSTVSSITEDSNKKRKQFTFRITWKVEDDDDKDDATEATNTKDGDGKHKTGKKKDKKDEKGLSGGKVAAVAVGGVVVGALTAGVGLLAGMVVVGMGAAGGGAAMAMSSGEGKERSLVLASDSYHEAQNWRNAIESQINDMGDHLLGFGGHDALRRNRNHAAVRPEVRLQEVEDWITTSKWKIYDVYEGVRLLQISHPDAQTQSTHSNQSNGSAGGATVRNNLTAFASSRQPDEAPCMRVNIGINASTADTFSAIINFSNSLQTGIIKSMRIVENIDNFTDVIHVKLEPMFLYPSWTGEFRENLILLVVGVIFVVVYRRILFKTRHFLFSPRSNSLISSPTQ